MVKRHLKALFSTILILFLLIAGSFLFYKSFYIITKGIEFSSKNIDDRYGRLDTNTKLKLEKYLQTAMKEKNIEFFFSFVYEDINDCYAKQLSENDKAIFIYYNDTTKKVNILTNLQLNDNEDFERILNSKEELITFIPNYVDLICNNIQNSSNQIYTTSMQTKTGVFITLGSGCYIIFSCIIVEYIRFMKRHFAYLKKRKSKKLQLKELDNQENMGN